MYSESLERTVCIKKVASCDDVTDTEQVLAVFVDLMWSNNIKKQCQHT